MTTVDRLVEAVKDAGAMLVTLQRLLPEPAGQGPNTGTIGRSAPESSEPWNDRVADAYWTIWIGAGSLVGQMRAALGLSAMTFPPRGVDALKAITNMGPACTPALEAEVCRWLEKWTDRARQVPDIDESEPWTPVPGVGPRPPACPFCGTFALRMKRRAGEVRCFFPDCCDGDQNPTRARMEPGRMSGEARLVFADGTMMHWSGSDDASV